MRFATLVSLLSIATTSLTAVLPRQVNSTSSSDTFILHSKLLSNTTTSLGYLHAEYAYPPGYYAVLSTVRSDAITAYLSDTNSITNSSLEFPEGDGYSQGLVLGGLTREFPRGLAMIYSGREGSKGVYVDEGGDLGWALGGGRVSWYACQNQSLEYGKATGLWYKWSNVTTPSNCVDVELVAEFV